MRFVKEIFLKAGLGKEDASLIAEVLVESDVC
jgi:LDH2 family malate/lactate/ureidoglycolate dehydrogenase